ncbi:hypothetical protein WA026_017758 [Henosepilachna vigintioctopunctata]|uniref:Tetraspanin n=1 Tax=Henosepilachna vigintioctopunctata TaxID=420089 RepID=A0AAW1U0K7_9CUCU
MGCISFLVKNLVFVVNFIFAVAGLALLILGCVFKFAYVNKLSTDTIPSALNVVSILVIIVGSLVFVTSFLGCCGAIRNSVCMLRLYAAILLAFFIIQLTIGIYAFVKIKDSDFKNDVKEALDKSFQKYDSKNNQYKDAIDILQQSMECCGLYDASTWERLGIPSSCCADNSKPCFKSSKDFFTKGCFDELFSFLDVAFRVLGHVIIAIGAAELLGAIFGCYLSGNIARRIRERY